MKTRLAPTPSGYLHAGNAFNFLVTAELAKITGSAVVLRIDDLDAERTRPEFVEDVFRSLEWLGIQVDEGPSGPADFYAHWSQQLRMGRYVEMVDRLKSRGHIYPCNCSRARFDSMDRLVHRCRSAHCADGPAGTPWRLRIPDRCHVSIKELDGTSSQVDLSALMPDPIVQQRDTGRPSYQIASLCDDLAMGIRFVVRGADLLPSTACQLHIAALLEEEAFSVVRFHHHALSTDEAGRKLSKSAGSYSLKSMRESGGSPARLQAQARAYATGSWAGLRL